MSLRMIAPMLVASVMVTGCATKRYPVVTPLSGAEKAMYSCRELQLEMLKAEEVQLKITQTAETDWRSVAGFLGDYGIGNAMAKSEASRAVAERVSTIRAAQAEKGCLPGLESAAAPAATAPAAAAPAEAAPAAPAAAPATPG
jgi:hypothetical protein